MTQGTDRNDQALQGSTPHPPFQDGGTAAGTGAATSSEARARAWNVLEARLARTLEALTEDEFLILAHRGTQHFVQFAAQGDAELRAEAVSGFYTDDAQDVLDARHERLVALGWLAPTNLPDHLAGHEPEGSPNYYLDLRAPIPFEALAATTLRTLREGYQVLAPEDLEYEAFCNQRPMILPGLGLSTTALDEPSAEQPADVASPAAGASAGGELPDGAPRAIPDGRN